VIESDQRAAVDALLSRVQALERRVDDLERGRPGALPEADMPQALAAPALPPTLLRGGLHLAGRTLLVLAGAYLVRALTEAGTLPPALGVTLGLAYAAWWQLLAQREARALRLSSATFHGVSASLIAFSLIWETAARSGRLGSRAAGLALVGFALLGLAVAFRHRLAASAWLTTLAACATTLALLVARHDPLTAIVTLLALAAVLERVAFRDEWLGLRWCVAATLDLVALVLIALATLPEPPESYAALRGSDAALALVAMPALYVTSVAARTLRRGFPVKPFEAVQGALAAGLGLAGASRVLAAHGQASSLPALTAVALGALCYAVAFAHVEHRAGQGRNFYFYSTAGGLLILGGTRELGIGGGPVRLDALPLAWSALGLAAVALGRRFDRSTLRAHGSLYLLAAALASGLLAAGACALVGLPSAGSSWPAALAALGAALGWAILAGEREGATAARLPRMLLALLVVLALAEGARAALAAALGSWLAADAGAQAVARSAVLVALVLALAWLAPRGQPELGKLVYPLVAIGALKLLLQDLQAGRPATLVASLGLYGALLILLPRLQRREPPLSPSGSS
jgi:hypothetical protein